MIHHVRARLRHGLLTVAVALPAYIFINDNLLEITFIHGNSMAPTLSPDYRRTGSRDLILWKKLAPTRDLARDDLVVFRSPQRPESAAVKRVIGLEGDVILLDPRSRPASVINARPNPDALRWDAWGGRVRVPPGHVWVEGDNRRESLDSNAYGPISRALIEGKAISVILPWSRMGTQPWKVASLAHGKRTHVLIGAEAEKSGGYGFSSIPSWQIDKPKD